jgi:O-acetyl-ADP-ribose deacetylase (regulator of RNase III)
LNARYVFHAVGPRWFDDPRRFDLLQSIYTQCLELTVTLNCRTIAFLSISTGDFGFPIQESSDIVIKTVCDFLLVLHETGFDSPLEYVRFCLFSEKTSPIAKVPPNLAGTGVWG